MVGSSNRLRNMSLALIAVWITPVPSSPEAMVRPCGLNAANAIGMLPVRLKKLVSVLATFCWLMLRPPPPPPPGGVKFSLVLRKTLVPS